MATPTIKLPVTQRNSFLSLMPNDNSLALTHATSNTLTVDLINEVSTIFSTIKFCVQANPGPLPTTTSGSFVVPAAIGDTVASVGLTAAVLAVGATNIFVSDGTNAGIYHVTSGGGTTTVTLEIDTLVSGAFGATMASGAAVDPGNNGLIYKYTMSATASPSTLATLAIAGTEQYMLAANEGNYICWVECSGASSQQSYLTTRSSAIALVVS
jgi:hypothetical protein